MVHKVILFIDDVHFGLAIECADGWYKFQFASGLGSKGVSMSSAGQQAKVTIKRSAPTGKLIAIGMTKKALQDIIDYARNECGFNNSQYHLTLNNCRHFSAKLADYLGLGKQYDAATKEFYFCRN